MINTTIQNRFQAFLLHLFCSLVVAGVVIALVFVVWYPNKLATVTGVTEIFLILLVVDVTLGPLLTLIVFNRKKKELARDLLIICGLQLAALVYGLHTVAVARPAYVVFAIDRFELTHANELTQEKLAAVENATYKNIPWLGPVWVSAKPPISETERQKLLFSALETGNDLAQLPQYYEAYQNAKHEVIARLLPLTELEKHNPSNEKIYAKTIEKHADNLDNIGYLPLQGRVSDVSVIIDKSTGGVIEMVALRPWP